VITRIAAVVVLLFLATGCTSKKPEPRPSSTPPATTTTTTTESTPPPTAPPPLTRTLDPARHATEGTVCDLLTDAQARELGLPSPSNTYAIEGETITCYRKHALADREVEYVLWLDYDVLGSSFGRTDPEELHNRDVGGQPAVVIGADPTGFCQVDLGLAQRKGVEIIANDEDDKACALAVTIAERMVDNLDG
jgi:hypothetical protein